MKSYEEQLRELSDEEFGVKMQEVYDAMQRQERVPERMLAHWRACTRELIRRGIDDPVRYVRGRPRM